MFKSIKFIMTLTLLMGLMLTSHLGVAGALLTNGDFEQELNIGWHMSPIGANDSIIRNTNYDPDPDYEVNVHKGTGTGWVRLSQTVYVPSTDLKFACNANFYAYAASPDHWAASAIIIYYLNEVDSIMGQTRICRFTNGCPWQNSPTLHLIPAPENSWDNYAGNIDSELINLTGVDPLAIRKIEIALFDTTEC